MQWHIKLMLWKKFVVIMNWLTEFFVLNIHFIILRYSILVFVRSIPFFCHLLNGVMKDNSSAWDGLVCPISLHI